MSKALGIVYRTISTFLIKQAGFTHKTARTGAVTVIQRFGSALNLNPHLHGLFLSGVYAEDDYGKTRFYPVKAPSTAELNQIVHTIGQRIAGKLEREGLLERDTENA